MLNGPSFAPRFEHRIAVGDGDGPRRGPGSASISPAGPADLDGAAQAGTGPWPWTGRARRGPRPGRDSGRWSVALMATRLGPDGRVRGGARRRISPHLLQRVRPAGMDSLRCLAATTPPPAAPHPLEDPSERPSGVLAHPSPGSAPHGPAGALPAPARHRADPAPASAPCPSSTPSRTSPAHPPGDPRPWPAPGNPRPRSHHGPAVFAGSPT